MLPALQLCPPAVIFDRVARLLDELQRRLARPQPTADGIHKIRVCCKKLRSWIRLLRHRRSGNDWQHADKALQKVLHKLAPARDSVVLLQTVKQLQTGTRSTRHRAACRQVLAGLRTHAPVASATRTAPLSRRIVRELLASDRPTDKALNKGLQHAYVRSSRLARRAFAADYAIERLHRLRRWVKYLGYQLELVTLPTPANEKFRKQLVSLGSTLGRIHDLAVLQQQLGTDEFPGKTAIALVTAQAARLHQRLLQRAEVLARAVFVDMYQDA
jgi:CHAD domain-containing protein